MFLQPLSTALLHNPHPSTSK